MFSYIGKICENHLLFAICHKDMCIYIYMYVYITRIWMGPEWVHIWINVYEWVHNGSIYEYTYMNTLIASEYTNRLYIYIYRERETEARIHGQGLKQNAGAKTMGAWIFPRYHDLMRHPRFIANHTYSNVVVSWPCGNSTPVVQCCSVFGSRQNNRTKGEISLQPFRASRLISVWAQVQGEKQQAIHVSYAAGYFPSRQKQPQQWRRHLS